MSSTNANILLAACGHSCGNYGHCGCEGTCICESGYHVSANSQECVPGTFYLGTSLDNFSDKQHLQCRYIGHMSVSNVFQVRRDYLKGTLVF